MKSRLDALLRQRELLREHEQWLDDEIAAERARLGGRAAPDSPLVAATTTQDVPAGARTIAATTVSASAAAASPAPGITLPAEADVKGLHNEVRRGCMLYFVLAIAALAGLIAFIYWKYEWNPKDASDPEAPVTPPAESAPAGPG